MALLTPQCILTVSNVFFSLFLLLSVLFRPCGKAICCPLLGMIKNRANTLILMMFIGRC